ncbi:MAG: GDP-mannose 4,6-dehydratase [Betaproteobacteria bacterium]|nr:GDP-mannose 4,6-dehydratase [Betaproteobacteria bacterium]
MPVRSALITGINGQDGSYLAELLLSRGYAVHGIVRRDAIEDPAHRLVNIRHLLDRIQLHVGSVDNHLSVYRIVGQVLPDECYHLAAASFVSYSFDEEASVLASNFNSTHYLLSSIKELAPQCHFYFAGSSEMFGNADVAPQNESTRFNPRSIYGISKLAGYHLVCNYRRQHGLFACTGILYNHESPRRGFEFVTRKISSTVAKIQLGLADHLALGNVDARRDWGYAPEYVAAMPAMLAQPAPDDYVIATGTLHGVRDFLEAAFSVIGRDYRDYVRSAPEYFRPDETVPLHGDSSKAARLLAWKPVRTLPEIAAEMVRADIALLQGR